MSAPRPCRPDELPQAIALANRIFRGDAPEPHRRMERTYPHLFAPANVRNLWVVAEGELLVALCGMLPATLRLGPARIPVTRIGAVCTDPAARGRGLASALVETCADAARRAGSALLLISGARNLYRRLDCHPAGCFLTVTVACATTEPRPAPPPLPADAIARAAGLFAGEPVGFDLTEADWDAFRSGGHCMNRPARLVFLPDATNPAACAVVGAADPGGCAIVGALAGDRDVLQAGLPTLAAAVGAGTLRLQLAVPDAPLAARLASLGAAVLHEASAYTVRIVDIARLVGGLAPWFDPADASTVLGDEEEDGRLRLEASPDEALACSPADMLHLLFGHPEGRELELTGRPGLDRLLASLPLPLPVYGLAYV